MRERLIGLRRVLKPNGVLYLLVVRGSGEAVAEVSEQFCRL